jgi:hypothetical protein
MSSCLKEDNETLVLPKVKYARPIEEVIPVAMQEKLKVYMPIYSGSIPPEIDGAYLINPDVIVYSTQGGYNTTYMDKTIKFSNQNNATNVIVYEDKQGSSYAISDEVSVTGTLDKFTAYFNTSGTSEGISCKTATIISGSKTISGIKDFYSAFVMLEKGADPSGKLVNVGTYRIFKDGNGLASNTTWTSTKSAMINSLGTTMLQTESSNHINP